jgi:hypothetical protein
MGEALAPEREFDPYSLELPFEGELEALLGMVERRKAQLWRSGTSWLVVELLEGDAIGVPFARGSMDELGPIFARLAPHYKAQGKAKLWVRGRPGWARAVKEYADARVHSVCYEITERAQ